MARGVGSGGEGEGGDGAGTFDVFAQHLPAGASAKAECDHVEASLQIRYHPSEFNPADLLTKALGHILFRRHRDVIFGLKRIQGWVQNPLKSIVRDS